MKRDDFTLQLDFPHELIIDNFAGGGGTSTGLEAAFGRPVDIAINHDPEALAMHAMNHQPTQHLLESVWEVDPIKVTRNQPVALVWLSPELRERARLCAALLHEHLPEQFPELADLVLMLHNGQWWVLVDITLRMLKAPELFRAQSFPADYVIHEIPDPALLFAGGVQAADPLSVPRIKLSATAQVRMCGNSVAPAQAEALVRANFAHESRIYGRAAA